MMNYYAVIDTNVVVSALLRWDSVPGRIVEHALHGSIRPLFNEKILAEYEEVLSRKKFGFGDSVVERVLKGLRLRGTYLGESEVGEAMPDPKDIVFYAVTLTGREAYDARLVTGNAKHYPSKSFVVSPREMLDIIEGRTLNA